MHMRLCSVCIRLMSTASGVDWKPTGTNGAAGDSYLPEDGACDAERAGGPRSYFRVVAPGLDHDTEVCGSNHGAYALEAQSGYLLTAVDPAKPSVQLEDCVSFWPGHPDHVLEVKGVCEAGHYARLRTAGWIYQKPQAQTVPLYRCYSARDKSHFASNKADCEGLGAMERLLGYALSQ
jgi:hypothetical protein